MLSVSWQVRLCLTLSDSDLPRTSRQQNTHISEYREVCYPWHPWYGQSVLVRESFIRRGIAVCLCKIEGDRGRKSLEVPQWMLDRAICCSMKAVETPLVGVRDLVALKALLRNVALTASDELPQDQHRFSMLKGDADAELTKPSLRRATGAVLSPSQDTCLANAADRDQANHNSTTRQDATRPLRKTRRLRRHTGGV